MLKQKTADFTSQYDSAIGKVRELKQAYVDLYNIQSGGANGKYSKDELTEKISAQRDTIKALQQDVGNFYSSVYKNNQSNKNSIFDTKKFDEYERALDDMFTYSQYNGKNNNIIELMKKAYSNKRNAENKMLSLSGKSNVSGDIAIQKLLAENYDTAYESLRGQVKSIFGKDVAEKAISGIRDHYDLKQDQFVSNGTESFIKQIDTFVSTLKKAGYATSDVKSQFNDIKSSVLDMESRKTLLICLAKTVTCINSLMTKSNKMSLISGITYRIIISIQKNITGNRKIFLITGMILKKVKKPQPQNLQLLHPNSRIPQRIQRQILTL